MIQQPSNNTKKQSYNQATHAKHKQQYYKNSKEI
jgi:hypothetical protein